MDIDYSKRTQLYEGKAKIVSILDENPEHVVMYFKDDKLISIEEVTGNQNGITKVKAIAKFLPQGGFINSSMYYQNNVWVDGHEVHYKESPESKVQFKIVPY